MDFGAMLRGEVQGNEGVEEKQAPSTADASAAVDENTVVGTAASTDAAATDGQGVDENAAAEAVSEGQPADSSGASDTPAAASAEAGAEQGESEPEVVATGSAPSAPSTDVAAAGTLPVSGADQSETPAADPTLTDDAAPSEVPLAAPVAAQVSGAVANNDSTAPSTQRGAVVAAQAMTATVGAKAQVSAPNAQAIVEDGAVAPSSSTSPASQAAAVAVAKSAADISNIPHQPGQNQPAGAGAGADLAALMSNTTPAVIPGQITEGMLADGIGAANVNSLGNVIGADGLAASHALGRPEGVAGATSPTSLTGGAAVTAAMTASIDTQKQGWAPSLAAELIQIRDMGDSRMRINLAPAHLGHINCEITDTARGIELRIVTDSNAARDLMQDNNQDLRERFQEAGLMLAGFHCETGTGSAGSDAQDDAGYISSLGRIESDENLAHLPPQPVTGMRLLDLYA